jgi:hypothetical protein
MRWHGISDAFFYKLIQAQEQNCSRSKQIYAVYLNFCSILCSILSNFDIFTAKRMEK